MIWRFSDGTTVKLGGEIEGATILAQQLRRDLPEATVAPWAPPCDEKPVDPNDAAMLDAWLRRELWDRTSAGLKLTLKRPDNVPPLPRPPWADKPHDPDVVY
jgi:hypothetical protein